MDDPKALSDAVVKICSGEKTFNNKEIAEYTKATYSQDTITNHLIALFEEAKSIKNKENSSPSHNDSELR